LADGCDTRCVAGRRLRFWDSRIFAKAPKGLGPPPTMVEERNTERVCHAARLELLNENFFKALLVPLCNHTLDPASYLFVIAE
jgi:hypothetical protein